MAEREFEFGRILPATEEERLPIESFDPDIQALLASGDAIQGFPASMVSDRVGLPTALARGAADLFDTSRREVLIPAARELGDAIESYNPETFGFEERIEERLRPGVFMRPEEATSGPEARANMPLARGGSQAVDFAGDLIRSPETRAQAIETLRTVPETLAEQTKLSGIASLRGERVIDPETGMTGMPYDAFLSATTPLAVGRAVSDVPRASFGIFGSGGGKSGKQAEETVAMLEEAGLDPAEGWERQAGANTYQAYRSSLDGKVRYEIPMQNAKFSSVVRVTEDPDVEIGKILDPETRTEQRLLNLQRLRIEKNQFDDQEYIKLPGYSDYNEKELNTYGFTKRPELAGKDGLQLFPSPALDQILDFPELFEEYPQLKNIRVGPTSPLQIFVRGSYNPEEKVIQLARQKNTPDGRRQMMSTLMHEVQHAIQDIEGTYGGANVGMFQPFDFDKRRSVNREALSDLEKTLKQDLLSVEFDLPEKPGIKDSMKAFIRRGLSLAPLQKLQDLPVPEDLRLTQNRIVSYFKLRAEEENDLARGVLSQKEIQRQTRAEKLQRLEPEVFFADMPKDFVPREGILQQLQKRRELILSDPANYGGSDKELIRLNRALRKLGVKNSEQITEQLSGAFDDRIQQLRPLIKEQAELREVESQAYQMYAGNPGEVEARNTQLRFEGVLGRDNFGSNRTVYRDAEGKARSSDRTITPEELQRTFPEETQQMVLPEGGLVYSLAEGRKGQPSFSMDPPGNGGLEAKKAKLQQQRSTYDNRNAQLFESTAKPLEQSTVDRLKAERAKAGREVVRLQHEIDLEENEPNLPDSIITRDSSGQLLPRNDFYQANEYAFHGTRGAADRIIEDGGVHMNTDEPAFFMTESPAEAMTYGAGGLGDLGTVIPMRIDTRGFAEIDYGGRSYGELDEGGVVSVAFPRKTTFYGFEGTDFEVEVDFDDLVTVRVDGGKPTKVSEDLLEQYHPMGSALLNEEAFLNAVKDAGAPGARLMSIRDLDPTGAMMLRRTTKLNIPEENEILTVFDKSRQRLAKGNPAKADDFGQIGIARNPFKGFAVGGMVNNMRRRNISGLTNLFSKYNASGPLAGAGVPRGTMPVQMNQGGDPDFGGRPDYSQFDPSDYVRSQDPRRQVAPENVGFMNPGFTFGTQQDDILDAIYRSQTTEAQPFSPPLSSAPMSVQQQTAPFTPSSGIVAGGPAPGEVKVVDTGDAYTGQAQLPQPDPLPPPPPPPVVDVVQPPSEQVAPPAMLPPAPDLPPAVYQPPQPTEVTVPTEPMFTPPPVAATPELIDPVMLSGQTVDFGIADQITPQIGGYATTQGMNIAATGDPFADAVEGQYQMPIYRPQAAGAMPFLSLDFARPSQPSDAPPPPQSEDYSTGSYGRLEFAEALANYERMYGPVEDYQAPDTDAVMEDTSTTGSAASSVPSGTRFYPEPPPVKGSGGIGATAKFLAEKLNWEAKYGPIEDYYAAQEAARNEDINAYLSRQGEEAIAAQYGMTVEQLRDVNARRREQGLPPLGDINLPDYR